MTRIDSTFRRCAARWTPQALAGKAAKGSKLQHLAASVHHAQAPVQAHAEQASDTTMLGQPPPGTYIAPAVGGGPVVGVHISSSRVLFYTMDA